MAEPIKVFRCDWCNRTVAEQKPDGEVVIRQRHGSDWHETRIKLVDRQSQQ